MGWTILFSVLGWPVALPAAVLFGPLWAGYTKAMNTDTLRERQRALG